jgi:hypothetical protein
MPQTLLALLALTIAAFFTLGQKKASNETLNHVVKDEFELVVSGALLHAMEFADSRAFDEATTPQSLRSRLGLPLNMAGADTLGGDDLAMIRRSMFRAPDDLGINASASTPAGAVPGCNAFSPEATPLCNDLSDLHSEEWQLVSFSTPNGSPLPVQIRYEIAYVEPSAPDVAVDYRTFHKRVDVYARSPLLLRRDPNHMVHLRRVISYDPVVAAEYLRRHLTAEHDTDAEEIARLEALAAAAREAAAAARAEADAAAANAASLASAATRASRAVTDAEAAAVSANQALSNAQAALASAQTLLAQRQAAEATALQNRNAAEAAYNACRRNCNSLRNARNNARNAYDNAQDAREDAEDAVEDAQEAVEDAQPAATAAQQAVTQAQAAAAAAQQAATEAQQAAAAAEAQAQAAAAAAAAANAAAIAAGGTVPAGGTQP